MKKKSLDSGFRRNDDTIQPPAQAPILALQLLPVAEKKDVIASPRGEAIQKKNDKKIGLKIWLALLLSGATLLCGVCLKAQELNIVKIPHLINFQSTLTDPAGNPLADGKYNVLFRLLDASGNSLYEEWQNLEAQSSAVSAMVGSQNDLSLALLSPASLKFLSVQVEGQGPEIRMEIVSVPYAYYAEEAAQVAPKSIGTESIKPKAITAELLADDVLNNLVPSTVVQMSQLESLKNDYSGTTGASKIGTNGSFVYSHGGPVQNILKDLDTALYQRQVNLDQAKKDLDQKTSALDKKIGDEFVARTLADGSLQGSIDGLGARIDGVQTSANAAVNTAISNFNTDLSEVRRDVDTLQALPRIVAWGTVLPNALAGKYNASNLNASSGECAITFTNPVEPPYAVLITASGLSANFQYTVSNQTNTGFVARQNINGNTTCSFNFAVIK